MNSATSGRISEQRLRSTTFYAMGRASGRSWNSTQTLRTCKKKLKFLSYYCMHNFDSCRMMRCFYLVSLFSSFSLCVYLIIIMMTTACTTLLYIFGMLLLEIWDVTETWNEWNIYNKVVTLSVCSKPLEQAASEFSLYETNREKWFLIIFNLIMASDKFVTNHGP